MSKEKKLLTRAERRHKAFHERIVKLMQTPKKYHIIKVLPFEELYTVYNRHKRLKVFAQKGLACVVPGCTCIGSLLLVGEDPGGNIHVDVYTKDLELMTVDHINPVSLGGDRGDIKNMQPMCEFHNEEKGNSRTH